jgi:hypothetical protein
MPESAEELIRNYGIAKARAEQIWEALQMKKARVAWKRRAAEKAMRRV